MSLDEQHVSNLCCTWRLETEDFNRTNLTVGFLELFIYKSVHVGIGADGTTGKLLLELE